jgi:glyoxylase-like metal-dependent hydrolase (beta-lactamase superfamily II)
MSAFCYFVDGLLVDTGFSRARVILAEGLADMSLRACVITHHHEDHSGGGAWIMRHKGVTPLAHPAARPFLEGGFHLQPYRKIFWGGIEPFVPGVVGKTVETEHHTFAVIDLKGHTEDMIGLHEAREGWLFSADLYVLEKPTHFMPNDRYADIMASLERALRLDFDTLLCAHSPRLKGGKEALRRKHDYLEELGGKVADLAGRGMGPRDIRRRLLGREDFTSMATGGHFSKMNLVRSILEST